MAKYTAYDFVFTKRVKSTAEGVLLSLDLTDWMDSGEGAAGTPTAVAYNRETEADVSSLVLDADKDSLDSTDLFYLWVQAGTEGDDYELEVSWTTDADPAQTLIAVGRLSIRN